ncbi:hypothetical protein [Streptomyces sp. NPDC101249]|uniref:hypothetical protein n=1 Tax=Streptomyces sp. NPDC101249 TaxID=3366140 RepID=UPI00380E2D49
MRAYLAWAGHVAACSACRGLRCATAEPLAFQHRVAYEGAGKRRPVICGCGCAVGVESPRLRPGTASLPGLCYSHTGACRAPERGWR